MKYCKPSLHRLNVDSFEYPALHYFLGEHDYGNLERDTVVEVYFSEKVDGRYKDHAVFHSWPSQENLPEIRKFVDEFNSDLKASWDKVLMGLLSERETQLIKNIEDQKRELKETRKSIKKLQK